MVICLLSPHCKSILKLGANSKHMYTQFYYPLSCFYLVNQNPL